MTKHWFATAFLIASPVVATVPAAAQTAPTGSNGAAIVPAIPQPEVVSATSAPGVTILAQVAPVAQAPGAAAPAPGGAAATPPQAQAQIQPATPQVVPAPAAPSTPAPAQVPITVQALGIETGGGILLQLPRPVSTVIAADPRIARVQPVSPTSLFVIGVSQGRTTLIATNEAGLPIVQYEVTVRRAGSGETAVTAPAPGVPPAPPSARDIRAGNASAAQAAIRQHVQGAGGVKVTAVEGNLVLSGMVATPQQSLNVETIVKSFMGSQSGLINNMVVLSSMQVNVRVRVVEMSRSVARELNINWRNFGANNFFSGAFLGPAVDLTASAIGPVVVPSANWVLSGQYNRGGVNINGVIDALATDNLVTILAEPNLTTQSGEPASFLAGGEFPVPVSTGGSTGAVGVEFKQFGVALAVVPTILAPNRISLRVRPEVSEPDSTFGITVGSTGTVFGVSTRRAETTVELGSGQSFAIAGLLSSKLQDNAGTIPWLGEIPVIGALFKSTKFQRRETELVIIVTPYVVQPVSASAQLRTPADGFVPATDLNRILYGRQMRGGEARASGQPLDAGFILK